ncbi:hypothetical protein VTL71DRAFT_6835 [Oculimacula yallundae]|uniref:Uncharacterized protein n=1 Tax=Oculimacula yallundae TaxID=86028 RepID=A0ABR4BV17_9HELO
MRLHPLVALLGLAYYAASSSLPLVAVRYDKPERDLLRSENFPRNASALEKRFEPIELAAFDLAMHMKSRELFKLKFTGEGGTGRIRVTCVDCHTSGRLVVSTTPLEQVVTDVKEFFGKPVADIVNAFGLDLKIGIHDFFAHFEFDITFVARGTYTVNIWPPKGQSQDPKKHGLGSKSIAVALAVDLVFIVDASIDFTTGFEVIISDAYLIFNPLSGTVEKSDFSNSRSNSIPVHIIAGSACISASLRFSVRAGFQIDADGSGAGLEAGVFFDAPGYKACLQKTPQCGVMLTQSLFVDVGVYAKAVLEVNYKSLSAGPTKIHTLMSKALPSTCVQTNAPPPGPTLNPTPQPAAQPPCSSGLLICQVQDPTRLEAPWQGVTAPFPQCYDPKSYTCAFSFLCPINAPKISGQYACGAPQPPCGEGLLICQVQDPTRIESPWHGVSQPFPQCYDPALYTCASNFLCPIEAPKIDGQYACGPYGAACNSTTITSQTLTLCKSTLDWCPSSLMTTTVVPQTNCADATLTASTAYSAPLPTITDTVSFTSVVDPIVSVVETVNIFTEVYTRSVWVTTTIVTSSLSVETGMVYVQAPATYTIHINSNSTTTSMSSATSVVDGAATTDHSPTASVVEALGAAIASMGGFT